MTDWRARLATPGRRLRETLDALFLDHGILRLPWKNRAEVSPGKVWRSNQPSPADLAWAKARGVRSVVSARGGMAFGAYPLEREACENLGLAFHLFPFSSRTAPSKELMLRAAAFFDALEYPVLIHCKSGADRGGFLSALYLILHEGADVRLSAQSQLHWRFGHSRAAKTGILDHVFVHYLRANARAPISFRDWIEQNYDPAAIHADFKPSVLADVFASRLAGHE